MNLSQRLRTCAKHTGLDAVIELLTEAADEIDRLSAGKAADVTDERQAFEKWLGIRPCGAAHDLAWSAWKARTALSQQPATPEPVAWIVPDFGFLFPSRDAARRYLKNIGSTSHPTPLYSHPAPPVPGDVVRDAERYRWLLCNYLKFRLPDEAWKHGSLDEAIDAAMLAAK